MAAATGRWPGDRGAQAREEGVALGREEEEREKG